MKRIFFVEDDQSLIKGLSFALAKQGYETDIARTKLEAERLWQDGKYDLVILDVSLPDGSGYDICKKIRQTSKTPIIFLTAADEETDVIMGLDIGGDDYITKPFNPMELLARVKSQIRRYTNFGAARQETSEQIYSTGGLVINDDRKEVTVDGEPVKLTRIEYNILLFLVKNKGKVFSIDQIYEQIWKEEAYGADNTVTVHIRHIREKIEIDPKNPKYLKVIWGIGYKVEKL